MDNKKRTKGFKKDFQVEELLQLLDNNLSSVEEKLIEEHKSTAYPPIFIFGCARSGTTVLHQYLIQNIKCIYPSNFISRFYYAPYVGGLYYKLFTELDERDELLGNFEEEKQDFFSSDLGKTSGIHSPNEFWYFWRKHFPINKKGTIDKKNIDKLEANIFLKSIFGLQNLFDGPFITKGMIANNCIEFLENLFSKAIFIVIRRDLFANAKSLYKARLDYFNDPEEWYSFYPRDKKNYVELGPEEQVVRQVLDTNQEIEESLNRCESSRAIKISYTEFCRSPQNVLGMLQEIDKSIQITAKPVPTSFKIREKKGLPDGADEVIKKEIEHIIRK